MSTGNRPRFSSMSDESLVRLHAAFRQYMEAEPWLLLNDRNPYIFHSPDTGEPACCIALGYWRQEYGLGIYVGQYAQQHYLETIQLKHGHFLHQYRMMFASKRHYLKVPAPELERATRLGIEHPTEAWPEFLSNVRDQRRRADGRLNDSQAATMSQALEIGTDIARQIKAHTMEVVVDQRDHTSNDPVPALVVQLDEHGNWQYQAEQWAVTGQ